MKDIIMYTSNTCPHCHSAKAYFDEKGIAYTEKNTSEDPAAKKELIEKKFRGVPTILIGDEAVVGFDQTRIEELLGL